MKRQLGGAAESTPALASDSSAIDIINSTPELITLKNLREEEDKYNKSYY